MCQSPYVVSPTQRAGGNTDDRAHFLEAPSVVKMRQKSWLDISEDSPFSLDNLPFGIVAKSDTATPGTTAVAVGDLVVTLNDLAEGGAFAALPSIQPHLYVFNHDTLNAFAALGRALHNEVRLCVRDLLSENTTQPSLLRDNATLRSKAVRSQSEYQSMSPMKISDYTDFYAGLNHAFNVGVLFRGAANALQPNYKHLPVGYHGRASTVKPSGVPVRRPYGQYLPTPGSAKPVFAPCAKLDFELELAAFICKSNVQDCPIPIDQTEEYIFGYVLMNDWSARDIQAWEHVPLGPFN